MAKAEKGREKTNVMRTLEQAGIAYTPHWYDPEETKGTDIAVTLGESVECVFKTLVTEGPGREHFVFVIPVAETLDLKKAARAVGVKNIAMIPQKKPFPTFIDETALLCERFYCSAGRVGAQVEVSAEALAEYIGAEFADLTV